MRFMIKTSKNLQSRGHQLLTLVDIYCFNENNNYTLFILNKNSRYKKSKIP